VSEAQRHAIKRGDLESRLVRNTLPRAFEVSKNSVEIRRRTSTAGLAETLSPAPTTNPKPALFRYTPGPHQRFLRGFFRLSRAAAIRPRPECVRLRRNPLSLARSTGFGPSSGPPSGSATGGKGSGSLPVAGFGLTNTAPLRQKGPSCFIPSLRAK
jgi:hypothetical protein